MADVTHILRRRCEGVAIPEEIIEGWIAECASQMRPGESRWVMSGDSLVAIFRHAESGHVDGYICRVVEAFDVATDSFLTEDSTNG